MYKKLIYKFNKNGFIKIPNFFSKNEINKAKNKINEIYGLKKKELCGHHILKTFFF